MRQLVPVVQLVSVVADGQARFYFADEGSLSEFARVVVPATFDHERTAQLGLNLVSAIGLNGHAPSHRPVGERIEAALPRAPLRQRAPGGRTDAMGAIVDVVRAQPGATGAEIHHGSGLPKGTIFSALTRAVERGFVEKRGLTYFPVDGEPAVRRRPAQPRQQWVITVDEVLAYIAEHPGTTTAEIAGALLGESTKTTAQVIGNRLIPARKEGRVRTEDFMDPKWNRKRVRWFVADGG